MLGLRLIRHALRQLWVRQLGAATAAGIELTTHQLTGRRRKGGTVSFHRPVPPPGFYEPPDGEAVEV